MKFEEFKRNNQDKFIKQDVYAANRIRKTIEEMNLTDNEGGFELAKKYLIRNEKSSKKSLSKFLLNVLMSEMTRGTDLLVVFMLGLLSNFLSSKLDVAIKPCVVGLIVILIIIRCILNILLKNSYNELEPFEIRVLKDISYEQYKMLSAIYIENFYGIDDYCKISISKIQNFIVKKFRNINRNDILDFILWIGSIVYGAVLFVGLAILNTSADFIPWCGAVALTLAFLEYCRYGQYNLININESKQYSICEKFRKPAYESCKLLLAPTFIRGWWGQAPLNFEKAPTLIVESSKANAFYDNYERYIDKLNNNSVNYENIRKHISPNAFFDQKYRELSKEFKEELKNCTSLDILGLGQKHMISQLGSQFVSLVQRNATLRVVLGDPNGSSTVMCVQRSLRHDNVQEAVEEHMIAINELIRIKKTYSEQNVNVYIWDCFFPYTLYIFNYDPKRKNNKNKSIKIFVWLTNLFEEADKRQGFIVDEKMDKDIVESYIKQYNSVLTKAKEIKQELFNKSCN